MATEGSGAWGLVVPFWIDTDGYTDRDRLLFVCGVEFEMVRQQLARPIHTENASRIRLLCGRLNRVCEITSHDATWSTLRVPALRS